MRAITLVGISLCAVWGVIFADREAEALSPVPPYAVFFDVGSAVITSSSDNTLREAAARFPGSSGRARLRVYARTDGPEAKLHSIDLSAERGSVVKKRLVELGVPADRIQVWAYADSRPLVNAPAGTPEPQNQSVIIEVSLDP